MDKVISVLRETGSQVRRPRQEGIALLLLILNFGPRNAIPIYAGFVAKGWGTLPAVFSCISMKGYVKLLEKLFGKRITTILIIAAVVPAVLLKPEATEGPTSGSLSNELTSVDHGVVTCLRSVIHRPTDGSTLITTWGSCTTSACVSIATVNGCTLVGFLGVWINLTSVVTILKSSYPTISKFELIARQYHQSIPR